MKHLRTFEQQSSEKVNEILGWSKKEKLEAFTKDYNTKTSAWGRQGYEIPDEAGKAEIFKQAEADGYEGVVGATKDKKIIYKASKDVKWSGGMGSRGSAA